MTSTPTVPCFRVDPDRPRVLIDAVAAALCEPKVTGVVINIETVACARPALLAVLRDVAQAARRCNKAIALVGARPSLYKALHIAKIADLFSRASAPPP